MNANTSVVAIPSLYELFLCLADPREPQGRRHPLAAMLTLATTAILSGAKTLTDIAQFGRRRRKLCRAMGFTHKKPPCISTFHYLFKALDADVFERTLQEWLLAHHPQEVASNNPMLHIDGKALRGSRQGEIPGVHLLAAYSNTLGTALIEIPVDAKTNEHKAALKLLKLLPLQGLLVSGDAAFTQKDFSQEVTKHGGDYFLTVKDNQPSLNQALRDAFDAPISPSGNSGAAEGLAKSHVA